MRKLFGTDGIRAVAGEAPLDKQTIYAIGLALAARLGSGARVLLGMDTRESGPWIAAALTAGLRAGNATVDCAGVITTPAIAFLARKHGFSAGIVITIVGMTVVFVPQDLEYMQTTVATMNALNPRLIPLIAHDRTGFGSCVFNVGFLLLACLWCGRPSRHLWQAIAVATFVGFTAAIGIHPIVGYNNPVHLAPACLAAVCFIIGLLATRPRLLKWNARSERID